MKNTWIILIQLTLVVVAFMACKNDDMETVETIKSRAQEDIKTPDTTVNRLILQIGEKTFSATLANNATVTAFKARLPLTISMDELNANEKYYRFSGNLPSNPSNPGRIENGDIILYTSNTLVLFYETFSTSYTYTRIAKIDDVSGLKAALGSGNVTVLFSLDKTN
ncbi:hypothetical protein L0657_01365 [Dyadobacter sp. CY345]|uniref:cyclophilin-like fold protein n=1 Tax=Dyadobacter sp. CY345 TaxID=2909335 RepID=UPI001EEE73C5|nr:cyclophilin-like fold protein [Dyadobacter sp. CY345]MCF2442587.1 hypothetical protein [Dyadobacter sp. CY345]